MGKTFNDDDEITILSDTRQLNIRGNNKRSKCEIFWKVAVRTKEKESTHGAHERRHASSNSDETNHNSHAPLYQLII